MTIKHIKFEESEIMRSFEQLARERGLIGKEDDGILVKNAAHSLASSKKSDYSVTDNVSENILKLCEGLRAKGLVSRADKLETKFLELKTAERSHETHLYQAHDETGEDLLEFAHPSGSVEMAEAKDELGVVEDRLDQQRKMLEVINKAPTGKLATRNQLLAMVKMVLAQDLGGGDSKNITENIAEQFKNFATNFGNLLTELVISKIGRGTKYIDIKLPNGKEVNDYFNRTGLAGIQNMPAEFNSLAESFARHQDDKDVQKRIMGQADSLIKKVYELLKQITIAVNGVVKDGAVIFPASTEFSPLYATNVMNRLNPYQSAFLVVYTKVNDGDGSWHDQWFTIETLGAEFGNVYKILDVINTRIDLHIINATDEELKKSPQTLKLFKDVKEYNSAFKKMLGDLYNKANEFQASFANSKVKQLLGIEKLKEFAQGTDLLQELKFDSKKSFFVSLKNYPSAVLADCVKIIKVSGLDQRFKDAIIPYFESL